MANIQIPQKLQEAYNLYFDNIEKFTEAINTENENIYSLLENIKWGINDIKNDYKEYSFSEFLAMIVRINMIYECANAIYKIHKTENMVFFKFVRDIISHPAGLTNKVYQKEPYKRYIGDSGDVLKEKKSNGEKIEKGDIFIDFASVKQIEMYFGFDGIMQRLFEKEDDEFALKLNNPDSGHLLFLICPYSKIWNCLYDIIKQLLFPSNNE